MLALSKGRLALSNISIANRSNQWQWQHCYPSSYRHFLSTLQKGVVLKYDSFKGYGFAQVEDGSENVFLHRTDIMTDLPLEKLPFRFPYLRRGERIQFEITLDEHKSGDQFGRRAKQVQFETGQPIPAVRKNFLSSTERRIESKLGQKMLQVMKDETLTEDQQLKELKSYYQHITQDLQEVRKLLEGLGLNPDEYYATKKQRKGRSGDTKTEDYGEEAPSSSSSSTETTA